MSTQTPNLNLDLREASDIFNPLSTNANFESLDNIIYEIQTKGGVPTYTTTASANLLKLSQNPTPNVTVFKFVAAGDANTWSYQETVNNIVALDGKQKTVRGGEMYVAWVNSANAMVVIAWPDVVNAQTFDGKGPAEWATKVQLDAVNETASNAVTVAQAATTIANSMKLKSTFLINSSYKKIAGQSLTIPCSWGSPFAYSISLRGGDDNIDIKVFSSYWSKANVGIGITRVNFPGAADRTLAIATFNYTATSFVIDRIYKLSGSVLTELSDDFDVAVSVHKQES